MSGKDILPGKDVEFDTLQEGIVKAVNDNALAWNIPASELSLLVPVQTEWTESWKIARNKLNCSTADRQRKKEARKAYMKVLRPFIQRWIFRNASMNAADIETCGLKPRNRRGEGSHEPLIPQKIKITRAESGTLLAQCEKVAGAEDYGCIMVAGRPLPATIKFNRQGQLLITQDVEPIPPGQLLFVIDENKSRKKRFTGLRPGTDYYFYFYTINFRGVSGLSEKVMLKCW